GQTPDAALEEILRCAGTQVDPKVVEAFEAAFPRWREEEIGATVRPLSLPAGRMMDAADAGGGACWGAPAATAERGGLGPAFSVVGCSVITS
ncbi:MAG: hypothetical protein ACM3W4_07690, partial [Ignavibacteriales bacterium]